MGEFMARVRRHLVKVYGLEPEQVEQMLNISLKSLAESLAQAQSALAENDLQALSRAAHKAKGMLLNAGLEQEAELALTIESRARDEKEDNYAELLNRLTQSIPSLIEQ